MLIAISEQGTWHTTPAGLLPSSGTLRLHVDQSTIPLRYEGKNLYRAPDIRIEVRLKTVAEGVEATLSLHLASERLITFFGIEWGPLQVTAQDKFFGNIPGFLEKDGVKPALTAQTEQQVAAMFGMFVRPGGNAFLAGVGDSHADASAFSLVDDRLRAGFRPERKLTGDHEFKLWLGWKSGPLELLQDYGRHLAPLGRGDGLAPTGWNSWDFYGGAVSMSDIEGEIAALEELPYRHRLSCLTVDMGWEEGWGQWTPNRRFPATLAELAGRIRASGWRPGIWTAPFQVSMFAPLARQNQDLFLHNAAGGLIVETDSPIGPVLLLDFSLPEVQGMVGRWFAAMREAGFELFKIDYVYEKYLAQAKYGARRIGKTGFARQIFQTIRTAVGPDAHIINCGATKEAVLGLVDSSRVTMDIHNFWGHIRNNARQLANAFWMNRRLWINDPDFAIVRHRDNCTARYLNMPHTPRPLTAGKEFWMRGPEASAEEMRLWLSVVRLNGGSVALSDSIQSLTAEGRADLGRLFPPLNAPFVPLDLFDGNRPGVWLSQDPQRPTLGLFNWEDESHVIELPPPVAGTLSATEFWSQRPVRLSGTVELGPRSGMLLEL